MSTKMTPSKNSIPFASGTLLPVPLVTKIDRGLRDLAVNYGLKGRLLPVWMQDHLQTWNFALYVVEDQEKRTYAELITEGELPKPIVNNQRHRRYEQIPDRVRQGDREEIRAKRAAEAHGLNRIRVTRALTSACVRRITARFLATRREF